jgi:hypothetical protein
MSILFLLKENSDVEYHTKGYKRITKGKAELEADLETEALLEALTFR